MTGHTLSIDRSAFLSKAYYFFYYSAVVSLIPYLAIYYGGLGLSGREIGLLTGIPPLISLISAPVWGGLADATQQHRRLLLLITLGSMLSIAILPLARSLALLIPVVAVYAFFISPIMPLIDNSVVEMLGERKSRYGRLRLWGAVGWGITAPLVGLLAERYGMLWHFLAFLMLMLVALLISRGLPISQAGIGSHFWQGLRSLLSNRQWALFLTMVFIAGISMSMIGNFLFLYLEDLKAGGTLMGLSLTVATISEVPVMFFADRLLQRWGARGLLYTSLGTYILRLLAYSFTHSPGVVLLIQLLHGPTFSAMWISSVSYAVEIAPAGMGATAQGLLSGTLMGVGSMVGPLLGGVLYDSVGPVLMFRWAGVGLLAGTLLFLLAERSMGRAAFHGVGLERK